MQVVTKSGRFGSWLSIRPLQDEPSLLYLFSELFETHAVNTYGTFIDKNEELLLKELLGSVSIENRFIYGVALAAAGASLLSGDTAGVEGVADTASLDAVADAAGFLGFGKLLKTLALDGNDAKNLAGGALELDGAAVVGLEKIGEVVLTIAETIATSNPDAACPSIQKAT